MNLIPSKRKRNRNRLYVLVLIITGIAISTLAAWFYGTEHGSYYRYYAADSLLTTRHGDWATILIGREGVRERELYYAEQFDRMAAASSSDPLLNANSPHDKLYHVQKIAGKHYEGYLLYIYDPSKLKIGMTSTRGKGETVSAMVRNYSAIAGVNGGAFLDPEHLGDGAVPSGVVISSGEILFSSVQHDEPVHIVGIDQDGVLIAGKYPPSMLEELGIREAVTFAPKFVSDGQGLIESPLDGYGLAPRTAVGQLEDGTIVFAVIDGRQLHSIGASLYDLQQLYLELGAITAANLDGGASTELVVGERIMNKPATRLGERPIPTAWLLVEDPDSVTVTNPWSDIDPKEWQQ